MSISLSAKLVANGICAALISSILGCSQQEHPVVQVEAPIAQPTPKKPVEPKVVAPPIVAKPTPRPKPLPTPTPPVETSRETVPTRPDPVSPPVQTQTPAPGPVVDPLRDLVRLGTFESASGKMAEYANLTPSPGATSPGLYEDAILLSRLRAGLKAAALEKNGFAETAKVNAGVVTLNAPEGTPQATSASAVDAALAIPGVKKVIIFLP